MFTRIFLLIILSYLSFVLCAQETGCAISGSIMDKASGQPVEFATVQLLKSDSTVEASTITDKKGRFTIINIQPADYILHASFIGYEKTNKAISVRPGQSRLNAGVLEIF